MARIAGVDLPREKRVEIGLTYIFGIGRKTADDILKGTGINPDTRVKDLTEDEISQLRDYIDKNCVVEGDLRRDTALNIKRLIEIGCYRGTRQEGPARKRPALQDECPYQKRSQKDHRQQEEVRRVSNYGDCQSEGRQEGCAHPPPRAQEH